MKVGPFCEKRAPRPTRYRGPILALPDFDETLVKFPELVRAQITKSARPGAPRGTPAAGRTFAEDSGDPEAGGGSISV
jgi:hypothetical protein